MKQPEGSIVIRLIDASFKDTERYRKIIHELFVRGCLNIRNGSFTVHLDHDGNIGSGEKRVTWKSDRPLLEEPKQKVDIESYPHDNSK